MREIKYLNTSCQHLIEDVRPLLHESHVHGGGVRTLAILHGVDETVPELFDGTQQVLFDEVHHAVVWRERTQRAFEPGVESDTDADMGI